MKISKSNLLLTVLIVFFSACNSENEKKADDKPVAADTAAAKADPLTVLKTAFKTFADTSDFFCLNAGGMANFILSDGDGQQMVTKFDELYGVDSDNDRINALERNYYADACTIKAIAAFFKTNTRYDGLRIHFGAATISDATTYQKPPYQNKTALYFYPTKRSTVSDQHKDATEVLIPLPACAATRQYIQDFAPNVSNQLTVFKNLYHQRASQSNPAQKILSKSVWIDSCVFNFMAAIIDLSQGQIQGINIKTAAYLGTETRQPMGKTAINQSTLIFVPVVNGVDDWKILTFLIEILQQKWLKAGNKSNFVDVLNHGELCPSRCGD